MRQISPVFKATQLSNDPLKSRAKVRWFMGQCKKGHDYLEGTHKYQLHANSKPQNEFRVMVGKDAKALNDQLRQEFIKACGEAYPSPAPIPLKRWNVVERNVEKQLA